MQCMSRRFLFSYISSNEDPLIIAQPKHRILIHAILYSVTPGNLLALFDYVYLSVVAHFRGQRLQIPMSVSYSAYGFTAKLATAQYRAFV